MSKFEGASEVYVCSNYTDADRAITHIHAHPEIKRIYGSYYNCNYLFTHLLSKLENGTQINDLDLQMDVLNEVHCTNLVRYINTNAVLKKITLICASIDHIYLHSIFSSLSNKASLNSGISKLKRIAINATKVTGMNSDLRDYHDCICNIVAGNSVEYLYASFPIIWLKSATDTLIENLANNTTLTSFSASINSAFDAKRLVHGISKNTKLLSLNLFPMSEWTTGMDYSTKKLLDRNRSMLWSNVHKELLSFTLVFYKLPAYVVLEIFDWLPSSYTEDTNVSAMHLISHYKKIQLIINVIKSIKLMKN